MGRGLRIYRAVIEYYQSRVLPRDTEVSGFLRQRSGNQAGGHETAEYHLRPQYRRHRGKAAKEAPPCQRVAAATEQFPVSAYGIRRIHCPDTLGDFFQAHDRLLASTLFLTVWAAASR